MSCDSTTLFVGQQPNLTFDCRDDTLNDEIQSIRSLLDRASSGSDRDRASALDRAEKKLRAAQGTKKSYKMETRLVPDPRQKQMFENKLKGLSEQLSQCANDIKALRGNQQRGELFVGARGDQTNVRGEMSGAEAGSMMIDEMNDIQDKTKSSIMNTKNMVAASKQVGEATMEELLRQREQIRNIDDEVMRVDDNLNRADKLIKNFGKRMATDRFIQCFACVNMLLLVGVIIYSVMMKNKGGGLGQNNSTPPADPVGGGRMLRGFLFGDEYDADWAG